MKRPVALLVLLTLLCSLTVCAEIPQHRASLMYRRAVKMRRRYQILH